MGYKGLFAVGMVIACLAAPAMATVVADTGTPIANTYYTLDSDQSLFGRFTSTVDTITGIQGYLLNETGATQTITAKLYGESGSAPDFANLLGLTSFTIDSQPFAIQLVGATGLSFSVVSGSNFWIEFDNGSNNSALVAPNGAPNPLSGYGAINSSHDGAFYRLDNLNLGFAVTGDDSAAAVPEPATWALMVIGFGAIGSLTRRHTAKVAFS